MNLRMRTLFGAPPDPWRGVSVDTADSARVADAVRAAADGQMFVSVLGARGCGKTRAVRSALRGVNARVAEPLRLDREKLHLGDVQSAIVRDLSSEKPRRSGEARSGQVRRLLGISDEPVLLLIDDAHVLHHQTIRGLKRLRELSFRGRSPLLGVVLVGQHDSAARVPEVGLRLDKTTMAGLSPGEAAEALTLALGKKAFRGGALSALSSSPRARTWLDLQALADDCMAEAVARGEDAITAEAARAVLGGKPDGGERAPAGDEAVGNHLSERLGAGRADAA